MCSYIRRSLNLKTCVNIFGLGRMYMNPLSLFVVLDYVQTVCSWNVPRTYWQLEKGRDCGMLFLTIKDFMWVSIRMRRIEKTFLNAKTNYLYRFVQLWAVYGPVDLETLCSKNVSRTYLYVSGECIMQSIFPQTKTLCEHSFVWWGRECVILC